MDNYRGNDPEEYSIFDGESEDDWADSHVIRRITEDLREVYVLPLDATTQSKHLAAIADAISQNARSPRTLAPAQRPFTDGSRCASSFVGAAGPRRVAKQVSTASLASPFGARTPGTSSGPVPAPRTSLAAVASPSDTKSAHVVRWMRPGAFVNSLASKAAVIATAMALGASGLAVAGSLPDPVQTAFSEAAGVIGLEIPAPIKPPAVMPTPPREQPVAPPLPEPMPVTLPEPLPALIVPPPAPASEAPVVQAPPPATQIAPPAAPGDLQIWLTELIRQALATANARAMNPQPQPGAQTGQPSGQPGGQSWTTDNPWQSYGTKGGEAKPTTSSTRSQSPSNPPQAKPQTQPAAASSYDD